MTAPLRYRAVWLAVGWALVAGTWIGCLLPARDLHAISRIPDKLQHAATFFVLTLWFAGLYARRALPRIGLAFFLMGCAIELAQGAFTTTRDMDWRDAVADGVGILVALAVAYAGAAGWAERVERKLGLRTSSA
jgi:VanZ family protein